MAKMSTIYCFSVLCPVVEVDKLESLSPLNKEKKEIQKNNVVVKIFFLFGHICHLNYLFFFGMVS